MAVYSGDLIQINGNTIPKILSYKLSYCKLWASDSGRSMTGEMKGTLIGIFPKIELEIGQMTEDETAAFFTLVNKGSANVTYYDTEYKRQETASFYFGDAVDELSRKSNMSHKQTSISIIANKKRT